MLDRLVKMKLYIDRAVKAKSVFKYILSPLISVRSVFFIGEVLFILMGRRRSRQRKMLSQIKRVLVLRLDKIGDVVLTTPFLRELRRNLPSAWISLVVKSRTYNLVELCPYVDEVLIFNGEDFTYDLETVKGFKKILRHHGKAIRFAQRHFWKHHFDLAIIPRFDADFYHTIFLAYFSGASMRVSYSETVSMWKCRLNKGFDRLLTHVLNDNFLCHEVRRNLNLIRFLGGKIKDEHLELWLNSDDESFAAIRMETAGLRSKSLLIALGIGAGHPKRQWPIDRFLELSKWLVSIHEAQMVIIGGDEDKPLAMQLSKELGDHVVSFAGRATLRQSAALLKNCHLFIGSDSGPMHLMAAMGGCVIEISYVPRTGASSHWNSPKRFGPWGVNQVVLQPETAVSPCKRICTAVRPHCILSISVDQVKEAVNVLLKQSAVDNV